jgi:glutathione peroxidase
MTKLSDFSVRTPAGEDTSLSIYEGHVVLIVNTASRCGFTPQYAGLEQLYRDYKDKGLVVLGFPCNQFGAQEPGNAEEIASFCKLTYDVTFPMFAKIDVNGKEADPLFVWLEQQAPGLMGSTGIKWNFTKFLIGRDGQVTERFAPTTTPDALRGAIEKLL